MYIYIYKIRFLCGGSATYSIKTHRATPKLQQTVLEPLSPVCREKPKKKHGMQVL